MLIMSKEEQNEKNSILKTMYEIVKDNSYIYKDMSNTYYCKPFENVLINIDSEEFLTWCLSICRKKGDIFPTKEKSKVSFKGFRGNCLPGLLYFKTLCLSQ